MSIVIEVTEAVKEAINAATLSQAVTSQRHYQPQFGLEDMKELRVSVVPNGVTTATLGRGRAQHDCRVDVAIQKKLKKSDLAEIDPLMDLVDEIADHFRTKRLEGVPTAVCVRTENSALYAQEHLAELRQFTSVLTLTFRVTK